MKLSNKIKREYSQYFIRELLYLKSILKQDKDNNELFISKDYISNKIDMILRGGINIHPINKAFVDKQMKELFPDNLTESTEGYDF